MAPLTLLEPHWEALTPETRQAYHLVAGLELIHAFYLAGGTGLALHLGHRFSIDLDFFSQEPGSVGPDERSVLRQALDDPTLGITFDFVQSCSQKICPCAQFCDQRHAGAGLF